MVIESSKIVVPFDEIGADSWDSYVCSHTDGCVYHLSAFKSSIEKMYGHKNYYFALVDNNKKICGVLPIFFVKSVLLGDSLVSIPFCDYGGILADSSISFETLYKHAIKISEQINCKQLELRQTSEIPFLQSDKTCIPKTSKNRMHLVLPSTSDALFQSFPAKLRSQIRKPQKDGCTIKHGHKELLDEFYQVFTYNMRDLGSPVHSKKFLLSVLEEYKDKAQIFIVYLDNKPIGCSVGIGHCSTLINPWASFDKRYRKNAPNMLLYWGMLEYAIQQGYTGFDFGRSTVGEGTFKFKEQWGAKPQTLWWYYKGADSADQNDEETGPPGWKKQLFISVWRLIPLPVTSFLGPIIRKQISL
jgi:FemAB-related protein (PEP-CTERM system-associated)